MLTRSKKSTSRLVFGSLTLGPLQKNFSVKDGAGLLLYGYEKGINILDTAELYDNYQMIGEMFSHSGIKREDYFVITKSYAYDKVSLQKSIDLALTQMKTDYIDAFLLHEQESDHTLRGHFGATEELLKLKAQGVVDKIGVSTHFIDGVKAASKYPYFDILHPIINKAGFGIQDGQREDMEKAIQGFAGYRYAMKVFGGGSLLFDRTSMLDYVLSLDFIDGIAIGMQNKKEIEYNANYVNHAMVSADLPEIAQKRLSIAFWCDGCGRCVSKCQQNALQLVNNRCEVDHSKCTLCGYCAAVCPQVCIKVF